MIGPHTALETHRRAREVAWFVDLAFFTAPLCTEPSFEALLTWASRWVDVSGLDPIRRRLALDSESRREAETRLLAMLSAATRLPARVTLAYENPERNVDWAATYVDALGRRPERYLAAERRMVVDSTVARTLGGVAIRWAEHLDALGWHGEHRDRAKRLRAAAHDGRGALFMPTSSVQRHLASAGEAGRGLLAAWRRATVDTSVRLDHPSIEGRRALGALAADLIGHVDNVNDLLELTARLEILRCALTGPDPWRLVAPLDHGRGGKPLIALEHGDLRLDLTKGRPVNPANGEPVPDLMEDVARGAGLGFAGNQPDLVFSFWRASRPAQSALVLGDARHNACDDGRGYLRDAIDAAATYFTSYGHAMRLSFGPSGITGPVDPALTLFCLQTPPGPLGDAPTTVARLADEAALPWTIAFDFARHYGPDAPRCADGPGSAVVDAWFRRVEGRVRRVLRLSARERHRGTEHRVA